MIGYLAGWDDYYVRYSQSSDRIYSDKPSEKDGRGAVGKKWVVKCSFWSAIAPVAGFRVGGSPVTRKVQIMTQYVSIIKINDFLYTVPLQERTLLIRVLNFQEGMCTVCMYTVWNGGIRCRCVIIIIIPMGLCVQSSGRVARIAVIACFDSFRVGRSGESGKKELRTRSVTTGAVPFTNLLFTTRPYNRSAPVLNISNWP